MLRTWQEPSAIEERLSRLEDAVLNSVPKKRAVQDMELFIRALQAALDSFIKPLSGKSYAKELIDGAAEFKEYLFPDKDNKK
jgi:hypothetical protein